MSESAGSRPSVANCADADIGGESGSNGGIGADENESIRRIVENLDAEYSELAKRALSAVPGDRLRKECVREIRGSGSGFKSRIVRAVLKEFLRWFLKQQDMQIVFSDPDGEEVPAPLENAYSEEYIREKYGVIKDGERGAVADAANLCTTMITLSGSNLNELGKPRCPGDHLRDLKDSWGILRRELQRVMTDAGFERYDPDAPDRAWWEYAVVVEPHKSGYAHMHIAVFTSEEVTPWRFKPVLDKHVEKCEMAGSDAHMIDPENPDESAVSVNTVDPSKEYDPDEDMEDITNLGSYLAEYIGACGEGLLDRPVNELVCYSLLWATETRRVQFSQGFHRLAATGAEIRGADVEGESVGWDCVGIKPDEESEPRAIHSGRICEECDFAHSDFTGEECPECGGELRSRSADYMERIRGIPGGDPPAFRE